MGKYITFAALTLLGLVACPAEPPPVPEDTEPGEDGGLDGDDPGPRLEYPQSHPGAVYLPDPVAGDDDDSSSQADDDDSSSPADDDDSSSQADDDDAPAPCEPVGPGLETAIVVNEPGWTLQLFSDQTPMPTGVDVDPVTAHVLVGTGMGQWASQPVRELTTVGTILASDAIADPDGVAWDSQGLAYGAGAGTIWRLDSLDGGSNWVWHTTGSNINDLRIDRDRGDDVYVGMDGGQAYRIDQAGAVTQLAPGHSGGATISLDGDGDLWVQRRGAGELLEVDRVTEVATVQATYSQLHSDYATTNRIAVRPADGTVWSASYYWGEGGTLTRWDPANPGQLDLVVTQMIDGANPDGMTWHGDCLYVTMPVGGLIATLCACED